MDWKLKFISQENFVKHVEATIDKYGEKLESFDIKRFNKNIIDPIKLIFDKTVYQSTWEEMVGNEIFRQRDKSNNNDIGYFHQTIFQYMKNCHVPENGKEGGWDVIYENADGIQLPEGDVVHKIYVEMKNKHNTMNSASTGKTYMKMQNQLLEYAIQEVKELNSGEVFLVRELFKGYLWNRIPRKDRLLLGILFLNWTQQKANIVTPINKTSSGQQKYQKI